MALLGAWDNSCEKYYEYYYELRWLIHSGCAFLNLAGRLTSSKNDFKYLQPTHEPILLRMDMKHDLRDIYLSLLLATIRPIERAIEQVLFNCFRSTEPTSQPFCFLLLQLWSFFLCPPQEERAGNFSSHSHSLRASVPSLAFKLLARSLASSALPFAS